MLSSSSGAAGPSTGRIRRFAVRCRSRVAWAMQTLIEEALQPGIEAIRIAEAPQVPPGDHQRVLQSILGSVDVAQDPVGDREEPIGAGANQVDVRRLIAVPCRLDEIAIHRILPPAHPSEGVVRLYW